MFNYRNKQTKKTPCQNSFEVNKSISQVVHFLIQIVKDVMFYEGQIGRGEGVLAPLNPFFFFEIKPPH